VQVKWVAPTDVFLEFGAEIGNGDAFPGSPRNINGAGAGAVSCTPGATSGTSSSWRAGLSYLETTAVDRVGTLPDIAGNIAQTSFAGKTRTTIADFVWKYAPDGNATRTNFKLQGEYFWQRASGDLTYDSDGSLGLTQTDAYSASQSGWYLQGIWQFMPMWRVGFRYDRLESGHSRLRRQRSVPRHRSVQSAAVDPDVRLDAVGIQPPAPSVCAEQGRPGFTDNQVFLQYILTLGAHGAHKF
jgi:hypothetical protein